MRSSSPTLPISRWAEVVLPFCCVVTLHGLIPGFVSQINSFVNPSGVDTVGERDSRAPGVLPTQEASRHSIVALMAQGKSYAGLDQPSWSILEQRRRYRRRYRAPGLVE